MNVLLQRVGVASLVLLLTLLAAPASASPFPVGTRVSVPADRVVSVDLVVDGPSVLWVTAEAPGLRSLRVTGMDASVQVFAIAGRAEATLPLYAPGRVTVECVNDFGGRLLIHSAYGVGSVVTMGELMALPPPPPAPAVVAPPKPAPAPKAETPVDTAPKVDTTPPPPPAPLKLAPVVRTNQLYFRENVSGVLTTLDPVASYRFYVPANTAFSVQVYGGSAARLSSGDNSFDQTGYGLGPKNFAVAAPDDKYFFVTVSGNGPYRISVNAQGEDQ